MIGLSNALDLAGQLAPVRIGDDAGVPLGVHHLEFLGIDAQAIADWRARRAPLGMFPGEYRDFCSSLFSAAVRDGLTDLDVRLKGSAAVIYSGLHKRMPMDWAEHLKAFAASYGRQPTSSEETDLRERFERFWSFQPLPRRRPFDAMRKLNLDREPSDYDIQISSAEIVRRCAVIAATLPGPPVPLRHPTYGFLSSTLVNVAIPMIMNWARRWTLSVKRPVAVKAFDQAGPENKTSNIGELSSHFRSYDWLITPPRPGQD